MWDEEKRLSQLKREKEREDHEEFLSKRSKMDHLGKLLEQSQQKCLILSKIQADSSILRKLHSSGFEMSQLFMVDLEE